MDALQEAGSPPTRPHPSRASHRISHGSRSALHHLPVISPCKTKTSRHTRRITPHSVARSRRPSRVLRGRNWTPKLQRDHAPETDVLSPPWTSRVSAAQVACLEVVPVRPSRPRAGPPMDAARHHFLELNTVAVAGVIEADTGVRPDNLRERVETTLRRQRRVVQHKRALPHAEVADLQDGRPGRAPAVPHTRSVQHLQHRDAGVPDAALDASRPVDRPPPVNRELPATPLHTAPPAVQDPAPVAGPLANDLLPPHPDDAETVADTPAAAEPRIPPRPHDQPRDARPPPGPERLDL